MDKIKTENTETEILIAAKEIFHQKGWLAQECKK
jgi:hypothetical protein